MSDDPEDEPPPPPLSLGPTFWIALTAGLACVIAGWLFAHFAPILLAPRP